MTSAVAWHLDDAFLNGTGGNQPSGVLADPAIVSVAKESGQAATTLVYDNIVKMFARLHPQSVQISVWVANTDCIPQLLSLTISVGTGGSFIPVMSESGGEFRMLSRPVLFMEKLPTLGTVGDIILADFSQYLIGIRREVTLNKSGHIGFDTDETAFRTIVRADGQGKWASAHTPNNGPSTSWCVRLDTRE